MTFEPFNAIFNFNIFFMKTLWDIICFFHLTYVHSQYFLIVHYVTQSLGCVLVLKKKYIGVAIRILTLPLKDSCCLKMVAILYKCVTVIYSHNLHTIFLISVVWRQAFMHCSITICLTFRYFSSCAHCLWHTFWH